MSGCSVCGYPHAPLDQCDPGTELGRDWPPWLRRVVRAWRADGLACDVHSLRGPDGWPVIAVRRGTRPAVLSTVRGPVWKGERLVVLTATGARLDAHFMSWFYTETNLLSVECSVWVRSEELVFSATTGRAADAPLWLERSSYDRVRRSYHLLGGRSDAKRAPVGGHDRPGPGQAQAQR